jgi:ribosomal protein L7/L12
MVNFSLKGIMEKIHRLQHVSASECDDNIIFPRVKRRLLHLKEESEETFTIPNADLITKEISKAKIDAIAVCKSCGMVLNSYEDKDLVQNVEKVVEEAIQHDHESSESTIIETDNSSCPNEVTMTPEDIVTINEDLSVIKLRKTASSVGIPTYQALDKDKIHSTGKNYSLSGKTKDTTKSKKSSTKAQKKSISPFVLYQGSYIRKSTALYLLQENCQISSDRLMRVRSEQPSHIFSGTEKNWSSKFGQVR